MLDGAFVSIDQLVRPLRLAIAVDPEDPSQLRHGAALASSQWGGTLWPIVARPETNDLGELTASMRGETLPFELDGFVDMTSALLEPQEGDDRFQRFLPGDLTATDRHVGFTGLGIPAAHCYQLLHAQQFQFVRHSAPDAVAICASDQEDLLSEVWFGARWDEPLLNETRSAFISTFQGTERAITTSDFAQLAAVKATGDETITPADVCLVSLSPYQGITSIQLLIIDPTSCRSVMDAWNLRALGRTVVPIPASEVQHVLSLLVQRTTPDAWTSGGDIPMTSISVCANVDANLAFDAQSQLAADGIEAKITDVGQLLRGRAIDRYFVDSPGQDSAQTTPRDGTVRWDVAVPPMAQNRLGLGRASFVSVVKFNVADVHDTEFAAELPSACDVPDGGTVVAHGFKFLATALRSKRDFPLPQRLPTVNEWLGSIGVSSSLSQPGVVTHELISRLGGLSQLGIVQSEHLIQALNQSAKLIDTGVSQPSARHTQVIRLPKLIEALSRSGLSAGEAREKIESLGERRVLQAGPIVSCPRCSQRSWFPLDALADEVICDTCARSFRYPMSDGFVPSNWAYLPLGAFRFPNFAQGAYATSFALAFMSTLANRRVLWSENRLVFRGDEKHEIDFVAGVSALDSEPGRVVPVFGECASFRPFTERDIKRAEWALTLHEDAIVAFATMAQAFDLDSQALIAPMAIRHPGRVLLLAADELLGPTRPDRQPLRGGRFGGVVLASIAKYLD